MTAPHVKGSREYLCYTDGSCKSGDGAPGGWGFHIRPPEGPPREGYGKASATLAKVMEVQAVAEAVAVLPSGVNVIVFSDNQPLVESLTKHFPVWRTNGFANVDPLIVAQVKRISETIDRLQLNLRFQWVRGHNGNAGNERADELARQGAREAKAELGHSTSTRRR